MNNLLDMLTTLIFPTRCLCCGKVTSSAENPCKRCVDGFVWLENTKCVKCSSPLNECACDEKSAISTVYAPYHYTKSAKPAIMRLKKKYDANAALFFSSKMAELVLKHKDEIMYIIPVPISAESRRAGRKNQALLLADNISKILGIPVLDNLIIKENSALPQHSLNRDDRFRNAKSAYRIIGEIPKNSTLLLVDDIFTTGATAMSIASLLKEAGCEKVIAVVAARAYSSDKVK